MIGVLKVGPLHSNLKVQVFALRFQFLIKIEKSQTVEKYFERSQIRCKGLPLVAIFVNLALATSSLAIAFVLFFACLVGCGLDDI